MSLKLESKDGVVLKMNVRCVVLFKTSEDAQRFRVQARNQGLTVDGIESVAFLVAPRSKTEELISEYDPLVYAHSYEPTPVKNEFESVSDQPDRVSTPSP